MQHLEAAGLIKEPPPHVRPTGKRWGASGYYYVESTEKLGQSWQAFEGYEYRLIYMDGCFLPFVEYRIPAKLR